ncbi:13830_t:CDS:2 [Ambispora leptoticha]|uniref:13830_t:CDS:1 n=1 Tax=Ambispora leptoticha TaxID=144679 RepID=A0A9N8ZHE6_9GLOM|nr:13830_t:CDS:2 [Ambispora leptoticha]
MNATEEKWSNVQQQQPSQQPPPPPQSQQSPSPSPHNLPHPTALNNNGQMNGAAGGNVSPENFLPTTYEYETQSQMPVHENDNQLYTPTKPDIDTPARPFQYQGSYVSMSSPNTPTPETPRQPGSPTAPITPQSAPEQRKVVDRPNYATGSFPATPIGVRRRRADSMGFPVDAGPFFSPTKQHFKIWSMDRTFSYKLRINSKVDRGFFLAESDWTCYRRNYFQISSAFSIEGNNNHQSSDGSEVPCLLEIEGQVHTIIGFHLGITAKVSNSDKKIELVQHTPKRDKGPQMVPQPKAIRPGGNLNLSSVGTNSNIVTFERIQFKTATANNGKRRAAQQYYVVLVDLFAQVENGELHCVATSQSAPLVVRGRSPGHYADNHDRYNPLAINTGYANDRHMGFHNSHAPNGNAGPMQPDYNAPPYSPYAQYPPTFAGYTGSPSPLRNDPISLMMSPPSNTPTHPFHPPQPSHPTYMVPSISDGSTAQDSNHHEMYHHPNLDPNITAHDQKIQHHHPHLEMHAIDGTGASAHSAFSSFEPRHNVHTNGNATKLMKIEIPPSTSEIPPSHPLTSPGFHSHDYVEGFQMYHQQHQNGHPANSAAVHHGGYHSDGDHHHNHANNGYQQTQQEQEHHQQHQTSSSPPSSSSPPPSHQLNGHNGHTNGTNGHSSSPTRREEEEVTRRASPVLNNDTKAAVPSPVTPTVATPSSATSPATTPKTPRRNSRKESATKPLTMRRPSTSKSSAASTEAANTNKTNKSEEADIKVSKRKREDNEV